MQGELTPRPRTPYLSTRGRSKHLKEDILVQGHKNGLLGTDSGLDKWPIRLASIAKCSGKTAREMVM